MDMDKTYYEAFLEGDMNGFESLVTKYREHLIFFIMRYISSTHIAEEIAQDAFVEVYIHKNRFHMDRSFKTYLFTIGRNLAVDYVRKNHREMEFADISEMDIRDEVILEEKIISDEKYSYLRNVIKQLKPKQQAVINLVYFEGMSIKETSKVMGVSESQVKTCIHRAKKKLAIMLGTIELD